VDVCGGTIVEFAVEAAIRLTFVVPVGSANLEI